MAARTYDQTAILSPHYSRQLRKFTASFSVTFFTLILLLAFLTPFVYMVVTSVKTKEQIVDAAFGSILPMDAMKFDYVGGEYNGKTYDAGSLDVYDVPFEDGTIRNLALINPTRATSLFIDPTTNEYVEWTGWGEYERKSPRNVLTPVLSINPHPENYQQAWELSNFPRLFRNTVIVAAFGIIGTLMSSICVAYAFARFPIPGKRILFLVLVGTIILPTQVTLVPTFTAFAKIGWTGARDGFPWGWLPLIVPHFFANAYNVFLLRQYFLTLPRELDEAAMIDGAGPFRILLSVIIPQSYPVIVAVSLFHLVFAWNDYFGPLIYMLGSEEFVPISVGIQIFNFQYGQQPHLIQATALLGLSLPVVLFFLAQRFFMRGVVITGVDK